MAGPQKRLRHLSWLFDLVRVMPYVRSGSTGSLAHFMLNQYEQARDWGQTAQITNPNLPWPPIHAAALVRLGNKVEAKGVLDDFLLRHPKYEINDIGERLGGTDPRVVESRERLVASLREIGMP